MRTSLLLFAALALGCGSSTPSASAPTSEGGETTTEPDGKATSAPTAEANNAPPKEEAVSLPTGCANPGEKVCTMPEAFAKKLCNGFYPDLALYMFSPNSPWTRAYVNLKKDTDAWNSRQGPASDAKLTYDEEVIIVSQQKPDLKGMTVSGAGASYDFLRWDGTCASLTAEEMSFQKPPKPKNPPIPWRSLEDGTKDALTKDDKFAKLAKDRMHECKGAAMGDVSDKCEKADKALNQAILDSVRKGVELPKPQKLP
ncbi:MAG: hypothetical protein U0441_36200 [Polyangiaceae bacterium]